MIVLSQVKALVERWYSDADNADMRARSLGFPPTWTAITQRACADDLLALVPAIEAQQQSADINADFIRQYQREVVGLKEYIEKLEKGLRKYGGHYPDCPRGKRLNVVCTCGYEQLTGKPANGDST